MTKASKMAAVQVWLCSALCLVGCYSSGTRRTERSAPTPGMMRDALNVTRWELDDTLSSLEELERLAGHAPGRYARFQRDCESLGVELAYLRRLPADVRAYRQELALAGSRSLSGGGVDKQSEVDVMVQLSALASKADTVAELLEPWLGNVQDIGRDIENPLDPAGVAAVAERIQRANAEAGALREVIAELIVQLDELTGVTTARAPTLQ